MVRLGEWAAIAPPVALFQKKAIPMKKIALLAFTAIAALALAACGSSESAKEEAEPGNVEMPAEEAVPADAGTPVADASADAGAADTDTTSGDPPVR
ncbi:hypothetical protein [Novosphingobium sp.]|uniref:hypothetical protein n=1 Tax=Novosphingobium sp. TaxID=1874826 RepID=UPI00286BF152|nr:hypothetical protein [Novosphingobium sp.]